jgi:hypothetical protein
LDEINAHQLVIVTHIGQKLSSVERKVALIVTDFWQLISRIFGQTIPAPPQSQSRALFYATNIS